MNKSQIRHDDGPICINPKHLPTSYHFCQQCGNRNQPLHKIFYCKECDMSNHMEFHNSHKASRVLVTDDAYHTKFQLFHQYLKNAYKQKRDSIYELLRAGQSEQKFKIAKQLVNKFLESSPGFYQSLGKNFSYKSYNKPQFRKFLVKSKFWLFSQGNKQIEKLTKNMGEIIYSQFQNFKVIAQYIKNPIPVFQISQFTVKIEKISNQIDIDIQIKKTQEKSKVYKKQLQLIKFLINMYSSFNTYQCQATLNQCQTLLKLYPKQVMLYYSKIRLLELIPKGNQLIPEVIKKICQIDPRFENKPLYFYFKSLCQWKIVDPSSYSKSGQPKNLFYEPKNQQYYKINNLQAYIDFLTKAISINQHQGYFAARGVGYIIKGQTSKAHNDLMKALNSCVNYDSIRNNLNYCDIKQKVAEQDLILDSLSLRSRQYIVNVAKYFKKQKKYDKVTQCCQLLLQRQPKNQKLIIQLFKSLIRGQNVTQDNLAQAEEILKNLSKSKQEQFQRYMKLQNKLNVSKARINHKKGNIDDAVRQFQSISNETKSPTAFYNQAVCLYQLNQYSDAKDAINKALQLKEKESYRILKVYICVNMQEIQQASSQLQFIKSENPQFSKLKQFILEKID